MYCLHGKGNDLKRQKILGGSHHAQSHLQRPWLQSETLENQMANPANVYRTHQQTQDKPTQAECYEISLEELPFCAILAWQLHTSLPKRKNC